MKMFLKEKIKRLISCLSKLNSLAIAFSGGVDSSLLLLFAKDAIKGPVIAVTSISFVHKKRDINDAKTLAKNIGVKHVLIDTKELSMPKFIMNTKERCYLCKKNLFKKIRLVSKKFNISNIAHGANIDDIRDYRPGQKAAKEDHIISPFIEAGFTKQDIRNIAREKGLYVWNKPSSPCLATRIPYGDIINRKKLNMVEQAENFLWNIGCKEVRVRYFKDTAKIEVPVYQIKDIINAREKILRKFKDIGFKYVTLDIEGLISGKMNRTINKGDYNE